MSSEFNLWPDDTKQIRAQRRLAVARIRLALGSATATAGHLAHLLNAEGAVEDPERLYQEWLAALVVAIKTAHAGARALQPAEPSDTYAEVAKYLRNNYKVQP